MAEDKIAAEERAAIDELRAAAARPPRAAAAKLIAERNDAKSDKRWSTRRSPGLVIERRLTARAVARLLLVLAARGADPFERLRARFAAASRLRSPRLTIPTSRSSASTTGRRRTWASLIRCATACDIVVVARADELVAHQVADRHVGAVALGDPAHGDIAVGDHADHLVVLAHRDRAGVRAEHEAGGFLRRLVGRDRLDSRGHHFTDFAMSSSLFRGKRTGGTGRSASGHFSVNRS